MSSRFKMPKDIENKWTALGFPPETVSLLFVVPLVQMAWAEGFVQGAERKTILRFAADLNLAPDSLGFKELLYWLDERPSDEFFLVATEILNSLLKAMPVRQRESLRNMLLIGCLEVARSSAVIGLHPKTERICREERKQLFELGSRLGFSASSAF